MQRFKRALGSFLRPIFGGLPPPPLDPPPKMSPQRPTPESVWGSPGGRGGGGVSPPREGA
eukprot:1658625-Alexandrium_andersonii.AAC.1